MRRAYNEVSERVDIDRYCCLLQAAERIEGGHIVRAHPRTDATLVREERYVVTTHAHGAMEEDDLTIFDLVRCFVTGRIVERQWDGKRAEWKYLVHGKATDHTDVVAVVKIGPTRRLVIVTVYRVNWEAH